MKKRTPADALTIWKGGSLIRLKKFSLPAEQIGGGKRSRITSFTGQTRRRLMYMLGKLNKTVLPVYAVLTFPDEYYPGNMDPILTKRAVKRFTQRLRDTYPDNGSIVRREHKPRLSGQHIGEFFPHFNFLIWGVDFEKLANWIPAAWFESCGSIIGKHLVYGSYVAPVENWRMVTVYISKYITKTDDFSQPGWGRWYGFINKQNLPWVDPFHVDLDRHRANILMRYMKRYIRSKRVKNPGTLHCLVNNTDFWADRLDEILPGSNTTAVA
jgi:hypothetical protein